MDHDFIDYSDMDYPNGVRKCTSCGLMEHDLGVLAALHAEDPREPLTCADRVAKYGQNSWQPKE